MLILCVLLTISTIIALCRSRGDMYKNVTPDYYGYRDDDDGILVQKEAKREVRFLSFRGKGPDTAGFCP